MCVLKQLECSSIETGMLTKLSSGFFFDNVHNSARDFTGNMHKM